MWEKVKNYAIENVIGLNVGFSLFILIFIIPQFFDGNSAMIALLRGLIFATGFGYILYKILVFRRDNKGFRASESKLLVDTAGSLIAIMAGLLFGLLLMLIVMVNKRKR